MVDSSLPSPSSSKKSFLVARAERTLCCRGGTALGGRKTLRVTCRAIRPRARARGRVREMNASTRRSLVEAGAGFKCRADVGQSEGVGECAVSSSRESVRWRDLAGVLLLLL